MREVLLIIHVLAAAAWIGAAGAQFVIMPRMIRAGDGTASTWMETIVQLGRVYYTPAALVILASGVGLVLDSPVYEFEQLFVVIGVAMVLIAGGLGGGVYGPRGREAAAAFAAGDAGTAKTATGTITRVAGVEIALLVVTVASMVYRWGV